MQPPTSRLRRLVTVLSIGAVIAAGSACVAFGMMAEFAYYKTLRP